MGRQFFITAICIIATTNFYFAQPDSLNRYNSDKKKQGYWRVFFDSKLQKIDSAKATFYAYDLYDNGKNLTRIFYVNNMDPDNVSYPGMDITKPQAVPLDGEFIYYNKRKTFKCVEMYKDGHPLTFTVFDLDEKNKVKDCISEFLDFTKLYKGERGTLYIEYRSCKEDKKTAYWYRKMGKKWKVDRIATFKPSEVDIKILQTQSVEPGK